MRKHGLFDPYPGYFLCHLRVSTITLAIAGDAAAIVGDAAAIAATSVVLATIPPLSCAAAIAAAIMLRGKRG